ncbi:MAG: DUF3108 domain-containing protein [Candidatus Eisenbacteria bacterium]|nr:DUF3108 domain-containing protein [Candidatus Eisenbacteria bacterium]MCC7143134.1 DUF3108 domain-containing protein [Candidatus Eisenbacteria bacterium]
MSPSGPARSLFALWLLLISAGLARAQSNDRAIAGSADSTAGAAAIPDTAAADRPGRNPAIVVGERLVFSVRYGKIPAGEATLSIVDRTTVDGHDCFHVVSTASSSAVFDKVYPVRDRYESYMDVDSLWSRHFEKHLREGRYKADQVVRLDQEAGIARYHDGREFPIPRGTYDVLSAFYIVRTMSLEDGAEFLLDSHADRKNYPIKVSVEKRERVETPAGTFDCIVVEPTLRSGAFFKHEGRLTIWLTDDERRIPVQMKSKIPVGSISVVLTELIRPEPEAAK